MTGEIEIKEDKFDNWFNAVMFSFFGVFMMFIAYNAFSWVSNKELELFESVLYYVFAGTFSLAGIAFSLFSLAFFKEIFKSK